ncbi:putative aarF domain-containing protein kinase 1 [Modicella reniformis]|uniref:AarF domain-containing protein kinase 1 n=1 Tax=Modicella reniformis TaxID=1440133 RepID=A0A9P6IKG8_9FUNG|nr:putative aarF domain-containing protein kinase 1 [Modicella reniformis]
MLMIGVETHVALIAMIYRKPLRLSARSKNESTNREIAKHMSVDPDQWWEVYMNLSLWISIPIEAGIAMTLLYGTLTDTGTRHGTRSTATCGLPSSSSLITLPSRPPPPGIGRSYFLNRIRFHVQSSSVHTTAPVPPPPRPPPPPASIIPRPPASIVPRSPQGLFNTPGSLPRRIKQGLWLGLGLGTVISAVGIAWSPSYREQSTIYSAALFRSLATFVTGCLCMADYKLLHFRYMSEGYLTETYKAARKVVHQRCADRLLGLCRLNTGIYCKAGQHVASLTYVVPPEYTNTLSILQDRAPFKSMKQVEKVFMEEFAGKRPLDLFREFDPIPMAAASLAQVHRAITKDGRVAAVKVQYNDVSRLFKTDMWTMQTLSNMVGFLFPDFELGWVVEEFRENLTSEFDFTIEARRPGNGSDFYVPEIYWDLSTKKILTMESIQVKINDLEHFSKHFHQRSAHPFGRSTKIF